MEDYKKPVSLLTVFFDSKGEPSGEGSATP